MARRKKKTNSYYQIKIVLEDAPVPIWRRLVLIAGVPLDLVHEIFQVTMGWSNYHPYEFIVGEKHYVPSDIVEEEEEQLGLQDASKFDLDEVLMEPGESLIYRYDFGDEWIHHVLLEEILEEEEGPIIAHCLCGKRACPPEEVGGVDGYDEFIEAIEDPDHPDRIEKLGWIGCDFDPDAFDARLVNLRLALLEQDLVEYALAEE